MNSDSLFFVYSDEKSLPSANSNTLVMTFDGDKYRQLSKLFIQLNKEFQFGGSFGNNLDALFDSMTDLSWLSEKKFVLIFQNTADFLIEEDEDKVLDFLNTLNDIGTSINDEPMFSDQSRSMKFYFESSDRIEQLMDDAYLIWEDF